MTPLLSGSALQLELIDKFCRFAELREDWNRLAGDVPMRQFEWAYTWAETMLGNGSLMLMVGSHQDQIIGIAPFYRQHHWQTGDTIRFLGDRDCCTDYSTFLAKPEHATEFVDQIAGWLAAHSVGYRIESDEMIASESDHWLGWDSIELQGVAHDDVAVRYFTDQLAAKDCRAVIKKIDSAWRLPLNPSWQDCVANLSKSQRRNVRRIQRRVLNTSKFRIRRATDRESLAFGMKWFRTLHQRRWESVGQPGCFGDESFAEFFDLVSQRMFDVGRLRLLWIETEGTPVAVDFSLLSDNCSYGYQMGVDPEYQHAEVGHALLLAAIRATADSGRTTFDFLRGDEDYKSRWGASPQPLATFRIIASRSLPKLRENLMEWGRDLKNKLVGNHNLDGDR